MAKRIFRIEFGSMGGELVIGKVNEQFVENWIGKREHGRFEERVRDVSKSREISRSERIGALFLCKQSDGVGAGDHGSKITPERGEMRRSSWWWFDGEWYCNRVSFEWHGSGVERN